MRGRERANGGLVAAASHLSPFLAAGLAAASPLASLDMAPCYIAVQPSAEQHSCALLGHVDVTSKADCEAAFKYTQTAAGFSHTASVGQSSLSVRLRGCYDQAQLSPIGLLQRDLESSRDGLRRRVQHIHTITSAAGRPAARRRLQRHR